MLKPAKRTASCWRRIAHICTVSALLTLSFNLTALSKLPVMFYSKMPADWMETEPSDELLSFRTLRMLLNHAELSTRFMPVSHSRAELLTKGDRAGCMTGVLDLANRRQQFIFSLPYLAVQGIHLYVNADSPYAQSILSQQSANDKASLEALLKQHSALLIGVDNDRGYGAALDGILQSPQHQRNVVFRHSGARIGELWRMLEEGRVDVVLDYPFIMKDKVHQRTHSLALTESTPIETAYIACNKSPSGQAIIRRLNQAIVARRFQQDYIDLHLSVIAEDQRGDYLQQYKNVMQADDE